MSSLHFIRPRAQARLCDFVILGSKAIYTSVGCQIESYGTAVEVSLRYSPRTQTILSFTAVLFFH